MVDRYLLESGSPDGYLLEDGSGVLSLDDTTFEIVNDVNTTVTYQGSGVYQITKTGGAGGTYDAGAVSAKSTSGDFVLRLEPVTTAGTGFYGGGLNDAPTSAQSLGDIDLFFGYSLDFGSWLIFENGTQITGSVIPNATYAWIWRVGTTVSYGRGATFAAAQASVERTTTSSATLYFDSTSQVSGSQLNAYFYTPIAPQSLTPSLFTNSQTFHAATVTATKTLTPSLFTNSQSFFAPTVAPGAVGLTPSLLANGQSFKVPTVSATYGLTPSLFTNNQSFFAPVITTANVLTPSLFSNGQTFPSAAVTTGYSLSPSLVGNSQSFFTPTVSASYSLTPTLASNSQTFYAPTATQPTVAQDLTAPLYENAQQFFAAVLTASQPAIVMPLGWHEQTKSGSWTAANYAGGTVWDEQDKSGDWSANSSTGGTVWNAKPKGNWN